MWLDLSTSWCNLHINYHWFWEFRTELAEKSWLWNLNSYKWYWWEKSLPIKHPLYDIFNHSDCDGVIKVNNRTLCSLRKIKMSNKFQDWYEEFMDMYEYALEKDEIIYFC